ncbi:SDR family oxidoreductase [Cystobacter fuscus]|uniref:SDR family oxidoreductase n=1 Tax=Cystobacter fuscus TaxID=43 RepID=UPI002B2C679C|nr:SDR family oxidoreductase [Cystobacter fuscus]
MTNQRIFITGGASGLGRSIALRYARAGWRVCIGDVNPTRGAEVLRELQALAPAALYMPCDVTRAEDLGAVAERLTADWGGVDVVVNNAGVAAPGAIEDVPLEDWQRVLDINVMGVVRGCYVFTPLFKRQGQGHFVNVASMAGLLDVPRSACYNASKAAVVSLSETLQNEFVGTRLGVTLVCPSFFKTNLAESLHNVDAATRAAVNRVLERSTVSAEDIAEQIFQAVRQRTFYVLPHVQGRQAWLMKRLLPRPLYMRLISSQLRRMRGSDSLKTA